MQPKHWLTGFLILALAIAAGFSSLHKTAARPAAVVVELWYYHDTVFEQSLNSIMAAFETSHPEIDLQATFHSYDALPDEYQTAVGAGGGPALVMGRSEWGVPFYRAGHILELTPYLSQALRDSIYPVALQASTYYGALLGLPQSMNGTVPFRNAVILPEPAGTYAELAAQVQAITNEELDGTYLERGPYYAEAHLYGMGGQLMDRFGCPAFNNSSGLAWVELLESFSELGPTAFYSTEAEHAYRVGGAGLITAEDSLLSNMVDLSPIPTPGPTPRPTPDPDFLQIAIDPWPAPLSGFVHVESIYLNPNTDPQTRSAAITFMDYLLSPEAQELMLPYYLPSVKGVHFANPLLAAATAALASGTAYPVLPQMAAFDDPLYLGLQSIFEDGAGPTAALQQATDEILARLAEMGYGCETQYLPAVWK
jgi:ABC-type glycerol-3-phosphate transport system substrate-binding protein